MALGISIREFAKRDGCNDKLVRRAISAGHLKTLADGTLAESAVGTGWRKSNRHADKGADTPRTVRTPRAKSAVEDLVELELEAQPHGGALKRSRKRIDDDEGDLDFDELGEDIVAQLLSGKQFNLAQAEKIKANALALRQMVNARREAGAVVEIELAERVIFEEARAIREAWANWPLRVAPKIAAELDVPADKVVEVLTAYVHEQQLALGEPEADFSG